MNLNEKINKMIELGFVSIIDNKDFLLQYNGYLWNEYDIENTSMAEIIQYKNFYDGVIKITTFEKTTKNIRDFK